LTQINEDDHEHCTRKYLQRKEDLLEEMEDQDMKPTSETSPDYNSKRRAACW
jgi:hypothetical protein